MQAQHKVILQQGHKNYRYVVSGHIHIAMTVFPVPVQNKKFEAQNGFLNTSRESSLKRFNYLCSSEPFKIPSVKSK